LQQELMAEVSKLKKENADLHAAHSAELELKLKQAQWEGANEVLVALLCIRD
jgi:hypothetical protein